MPRPFVQTLWFVLHMCFPSECVGFWWVLGRGCLGDQSPMRTLVAESLVGLPEQIHCKCVPGGRVTPRKEESVKKPPGTPPRPCSLVICCGQSWSRVQLHAKSFQFQSASERGRGLIDPQSRNFVPEFT